LCINLKLGDGLNIFQGVYLNCIGWNEGSIGIALSLMGFTALLVQTYAGDVIDKTAIDRRIFLAIASIITACSALAILFVREGNTDHAMIFLTKIIEGVASSFIIPCLAALTLACYGPDQFDKVMASNILWGHIGSVISASLAGLTAYLLYPNIKYCFVIIGLSAIFAVFFITHLPQGDPLMGRGFHSTFTAMKKDEIAQSDSDTEIGGCSCVSIPKAQGYWAVFTDYKTFILCATGFFFQ